MSNREAVIAAAKEAGCHHATEDDKGMRHWRCTNADMERLYAIAFEAGRQAEREDCAKLCESTYPEYGGANPYCFETPSECAEAIRARGDRYIKQSGLELKIVPLYAADGKA